MTYGGRSGSGLSSSSGGSTGGNLSGTSSTTSPTSFVPLFNTNETSVPPPGDPDPGEMIPVSEGWWILILLATGYAYLRRK